MEKGKCYIVCAGENYGLDFIPQKNDFVIAVDGGMKYLNQVQITANMWVGDLDSISEIPNVADKKLLNKEKDETDTFSAINEGIKRGYKEFFIYCGTGGRISHTIANIQCLTYLAKLGLKGYLFSNQEVITALCDGEFTMNGNGYISIFSANEKSTGVTLQGLKYPLNNHTISNSFPIGISNEFQNIPATIKVTNGCLLIVYTK